VARSPALPDVPTVGEFVPGYEADARNGLGAPAATPDDIIAKLNSATNAALADRAMRARLADLGSEPVAMTPAEFGQHIADETAKWAKVIKTAGIKAE
jgi:tripartite-type tricarboxylate transporter receptor subunit TctC